jgi:hypothetical protein
MAASNWADALRATRRTVQNENRHCAYQCLSLTGRIADRLFGVTHRTFSMPERFEVATKLFEAFGVGQTPTPLNNGPERRCGRHFFNARLSFVSNPRAARFCSFCHVLIDFMLIIAKSTRAQGNSEGEFAFFLQPSKVLSGIGNALFALQLRVGK